MAEAAAPRQNGGAHVAAARTAYLDALARRAAAQPPPIRAWLHARMAHAAGQFAARPGQPAGAGGESGASPGASPLAELLARLAEAARPATGPFAAAGAVPPAPSPAAELKTVARFRDTWAKLSSERLLAQTLAQAPANAGPMNSQHLVLRALTLMRDRSPDYLEGFMSYVDTLIWLEHASPIKPNGDRSPTGDGDRKAKRPKRG